MLCSKKQAECQLVLTQIGVSIHRAEIYNKLSNSITRHLFYSEAKQIRVLLIKVLLSVKIITTAGCHYVAHSKENERFTSNICLEIENDTSNSFSSISSCSNSQIRC